MKGQIGAVLLGCLLLPLKVVAQSSCPLELHVYANTTACSAQAPADAVGTIYPDGQCNQVQVVSDPSGTAADLLPGYYRANCNYDGRVNIYESGCGSSTCTATSTDICGRQLDHSSLYSRLSPPLFRLQSPNDTFISCFNLKSSDGSYQIVFYIFGDCTPCISSSTAPVATPGGSTSAPTVALSSPPPPTYNPTVATGNPTPPPFQQPTTFSPTPAGISQGGVPFSVKPTFAPTSEPSGRGSTRKPTTTTTHPGTTPSPSRLASPGQTPNKVPTHSPTNNHTINTNSTSPEATNPKDSKNLVGVIVGSVLGVTAALVCFLTTGFLLGRRLQKQQDVNSRKSGSASGKDLASPGNNTIPGSFTPTFESPIPTDHMISLDVDQDDISTLEDPTVVTRETRDSVVGTAYLNDDPTVTTNITKDTRDSVVGTQFLENDSPSIANDSRAYSASVTDSRAYSASVADSRAPTVFTNKTNGTKDSVLGISFLDEDGRGKPVPRTEDDEDDGAWQPVLPWFTKK